MAIKKQKIRTFSSNGDQHGSTDYFAWFNECGERVSLEGNDVWAWRVGKQYGKAKEIDKFVAAGFKEGVQPSNLEKIHQKLEEYIKAKDAPNFEGLLKINFIYPGKVSSYNPHTDCSVGDWSTCHEETYNVRPNVEALFVDNNAYFAALVDLLLEANDDSLYDAFSKSLANTDLNNSTLFKWDRDIQTKALSQLNNLLAYGESLERKKDRLAKEKGETAKGLALVLSEKVNDRVFNESPDNKTKFENLKFKLQMVNQIHQHDKQFSVHRGWKRIIANICSILFTGGIANCFNYKLTGNKLFFNKTETEQKICNFQSEIGFNSKEKIYYKK